jgi:DDE superfamily endonuclease
MNASIEVFQRDNKIKGVIGAIDGTYVAIKVPADQKPAYTNRKFFTSMTLQAISDHRLCFIDCFAGYPSASHDAKVFKASPIFDAINENPAQFPLSR